MPAQNSVSGTASAKGELALRKIGDPVQAESTVPPVPPEIPATGDQKVSVQVSRAGVVVKSAVASMGLYANADGQLIRALEIVVTDAQNVVLRELRDVGDSLSDEQVSNVTAALAALVGG